MVQIREGMTSLSWVLLHQHTKEEEEEDMEEGTTRGKEDMDKEDTIKEDNLITEINSPT